MIVTLKDRSTIYLPKEKGEVLRKAILDGTAPDWIGINGTVVQKSFIAKLEDGGQPPEGITDKSRLLEMPEISDEQRAKNLEKLAQIRRDFNKKRLAKAKAK